MKKIELPPKEFEEKLKTVNRIWDGYEGLGIHQAKHRIDLTEIKFIYVRDDNWSIACQEHDQSSCHRLWPNGWTTVYEKL